MISRPSLSELYEGPRPFQMHRWHHYIPIYERHFARFRNRPVNLLEIGVQGGGGLYMWHRYFHPQSAIHGVDINPDCVVPRFYNVRATIGDQADPALWAELLPKLGKLDIVIDDGGHTMHQQIASFEMIYHTMADDGVYLVEDTHTTLFGGDFHDRADGYTWMQKAHADTLRLMEWSGRPANFGTLMHNPRALDEDSNVSEFCRTTQGIHFYDSVVVYERGPRNAPGHELR
jgi:hypothetical protein